MGSQVFEDVLDLRVGVLAAGPPTAESYPYPTLAPTGRTDTRKCRTAVLENDYLKATIMPDLGGRLLLLFDKRTGVEILQGDLKPIGGGRRGAVLEAGVELHLDGRERLTSLATVQFAGQEAADDGAASIWLGEAVAGNGLSWHLHVSLADDRAELRLEARIFNRLFGPVAYNAGLFLPGAGGGFRIQDGWVTATGDRTWLAVVPESGELFASATQTRMCVSRFPEPRVLAPRQLDTWRVSLVPYSGFESLAAASREVGLSVSDDRLQIQATSTLSGSKLVLLTRSGKTLESPIQPTPAQLTDLALPEPAQAVAVLNAERKPVVRWDLDDPKAEIGSPIKSELAPRTRSYSVDDAAASTYDPCTRHWAHALLGIDAMANQEWAEAERRFEQALLYNGEDHLTWWLKSVAQRLAGESDQESPELMNAHFLAPLEPVLRAESFLAQPINPTRDPNLLLAPLRETPETFIEVACLLLDCRLFEEASRWIDEARRHVDLPMLQYLLAYAHLEASKLDAEAAELVGVASKSVPGPPYPWRDVEIKAIDALHRRFPADARLREMSGLIESCKIPY